MNILPPILFEPILVEKIWGGQQLRKKLNKKSSDNSKIGESWEISGYKSYSTRAISHPLENLTLNEILKKYKEELLGDISLPNDYFPLLYKFIDANDKLSIQVHPDDQQAIKNNWGTCGKTECWYIVDAGPDARINIGLKENTTLQDIKNGIAEGNLEQYLNYLDIKKGDVLYIPAGTVHAIQENTLIYEIQESSDTTFRLYDWDRKDQQGNSRPLHLAESLEVIKITDNLNYKIPPLIFNITSADNKTVATRSFRVVCKYFALEEYDFFTEITIILPPKKSFQVITCLGDQIVIKTTNNILQINKGQSVLIPAAQDNIIMEGKKGAKCLLSSIPDIKNEIIEPLKNFSFSEENIIALNGVDWENNHIAPFIK